MTHNLTVTVENPLWDEMKKYSEIRWGVIMKEAAKEKIKALELLEKISKNIKLTEKEIEDFSIKLGKRITSMEK